MKRSAVALAIMAISFSSVLGSAADLGVWPSGRTIGASTSDSGTNGVSAPTSSAHPTPGGPIKNRVDCVKAGGDWRYFAQKCDLPG